VAGKGIEKLQKAGIEVRITGPWTKDCTEINRRFFTFHTQRRPFITLKWARTADHFIAPLQQADNTERLKISGNTTDILVHQWRSEEAAILVGKNTALKDDPALTNRLYFGPSPIKMAFDPALEIPATARIFKSTGTVILFNFIRSETLYKQSQSVHTDGKNTEHHKNSQTVHYVQLDPDLPVPSQIAAYCYGQNIQSILVEGGLKLLQDFIDLGFWDECRVITNTQLKIGAGLDEPVLGKKELRGQIQLGQDKISYFAPDFA